MIFVATKKIVGDFFPPLLVLLLDPRSGIRNGQKSGSGINIPDPQHWYRYVSLSQGTICPRFGSRLNTQGDSSLSHRDE